MTCASPIRTAPPRQQRRRASWLGLVAVLALLAASVVACSSSGPATITVYSGRTEALIRPLLERFSKETGIGVDFKAGDSADLALLLANEGDKTPADVFIAQNPGATTYLDARDLLRPLSQDSLNKVDAAYRAPDGKWVGLSGRVRTLVYNTEKVARDTLPASVFDLTKPEYRGRVGLAPTNGSFQDFVSAMRAEKGDDVTRAWLKGMADNAPKTLANNVAIVEAVGRGEIDLGLVNHYYNAQAKKENPQAKTENHFFPNRDIGSLLLVTAVSITKSSAHVPEAERLVQFLLSEESQRYFAEETQEYPLAAGVKPSAGLPPLETLQTDTVDFAKLGAIDEVIAMIKESGLAR